MNWNLRGLHLLATPNSLAPFQAQAKKASLLSHNLKRNMEQPSCGNQLDGKQLRVSKSQPRTPWLWRVWKLIVSYFRHRRTMKLPGALQGCATSKSNRETAQFYTVYPSMLRRMLGDSFSNYTPNWLESCGPFKRFCMCGLFGCLLEFPNFWVYCVQVKLKTYTCLIAKFKPWEPSMSCSFQLKKPMATFNYRKNQTHSFAHKQSHGKEFILDSQDARLMAYNTEPIQQRSGFPDVLIR